MILSLYMRYWQRISHIPIIYTVGGRSVSALARTIYILNPLGHEGRHT